MKMSATSPATAIVRTFTESSEELQLTFFYEGVKREFMRKKHCTLSKTIDRIQRKLAPKTNRRHNNNNQSNCNNRNKINNDNGTKINHSSNNDDSSDNGNNQFLCIVLDDNAEVVQGDSTNIQSLISGGHLEINSHVYTIYVNPPLVTHMSLPTRIMTGFPIIPYVTFENACMENTLFTWYVRRIDTSIKTDTITLDASMNIKNQLRALGINFRISS